MFNITVTFSVPQGSMLEPIATICSLPFSNLNGIIIEMTTVRKNPKIYILHAFKLVFTI